MNDLYDFLPESSGALLRASPYVVSEEESGAVLRDLRFLRDAGILRLPPKIVVRFRFAPGETRGTALCQRGEYSVLLNAAEITESCEMRFVLCHEAKHLEQMVTGQWSQMTLAEREREADRFAARMLGL